MVKANTKKIMTSEDANNTSQIMAEQRQKIIAEAAYYIAEKRGFNEHHELDNWLEAEQAVDQATVH